MDALLTVCFWGTWTLFWFGHGCTGERMLLEHDRYHGLGMDALVTVLLGTWTLFWFGHGCFGDRMQPNKTVRLAGRKTNPMASG